MVRLTMYLGNKRIGSEAIQMVNGSGSFYLTKLLLEDKASKILEKADCEPRYFLEGVPWGYRKAPSLMDRVKDEFI